VRDLARALTSNLDGSPLAIEQASADLSNQGPPSVETLTKYMQRLEIEYSKLMEYELTTDDCPYEKDNKSIIGTFNLLENAVQERSDNALNILRLCCTIGPGNIPLPFCSPTLQDHDIISQIPSRTRSPQEGGIFNWMAGLAKEDAIKALTILQRFCCVKLAFVSGEIKHISVQQPIIRWCCGKLSRIEMDEWTVLAAYRIGQGSIMHRVTILEREYIPFVREADEKLLQRHGKNAVDLDDISRWYEWSAVARFATLYYRQKMFPMALRAIERAQQLELLMKGTLDRQTPAGLKQYHLFGLILRDHGDIGPACDVFVSLLSACKKILGSDDPFTMKVASESSSLWNKRHDNDRLLDQVQQSRDVKLHIWAPDRPLDPPNYSQIDRNHRPQDSFVHFPSAYINRPVQVTGFQVNKNAPGVSQQSTPDKDSAILTAAHSKHEEGRLRIFDSETGEAYSLERDALRAVCIPTKCFSLLIASQKTLILFFRGFAATGLYNSSEFKLGKVVYIILAKVVPSEFSHGDAHSPPPTGYPTIKLLTMANETLIRAKNEFLPRWREPQEFSAKYSLFLTLLLYVQIPPRRPSYK